MNFIPIQVCGRSLQQPPVPPFIVGYVGLHLAVLPLVCDQHAFYSSHLVETGRFSDK